MSMVTECLKDYSGFTALITQLTISMDFQSKLITHQQATRGQ